TMRLSDAGLRCRQSKLIYPNHPLPPWLTEDAPRDRSNLMVRLPRDARPEAASQQADKLTPERQGRQRPRHSHQRPAISAVHSILRRSQYPCADAAAPTKTPVRPCRQASRRSRADLEAEARRSKGGFNRVLPVNPRSTPSSAIKGSNDEVERRE